MAADELLNPFYSFVAGRVSFVCLEDWARWGGWGGRTEFDASSLTFTEGSLEGFEWFGGFASARFWLLDRAPLLDKRTRGSVVVGKVVVAGFSFLRLCLLESAAVRRRSVECLFSLCWPSFVVRVAGRNN